MNGNQMNRYRRSRKDYPIGVLGIYDNNGKTFDRYTVVYTPFKDNNQLYFPYVTMSDNPFHPQGFCQHNELCFRSTRRSGEKVINFKELPEDCKKVIFEDLKGDY